MPDLTPIELGTSPDEDERLYVHDVYNSIATHFSQTRYKPWPLISAFLASIPRGSIGLDSGTGNGKYLPLDLGGAICTVGLDRSSNLLQIAKRAGDKDRDVVLGDAMGFGWRAGAFVSCLCFTPVHIEEILSLAKDFAISIATIHHLSTAERRCRAIQARHDM